MDPLTYPTIGKIVWYWHCVQTFNWKIGKPIPHQERKYQWSRFEVTHNSTVMSGAGERQLIEITSFDSDTCRRSSRMLERHWTQLVNSGHIVEA